MTKVRSKSQALRKIRAIFFILGVDMWGEVWYKKPHKEPLVKACNWTTSGDGQETSGSFAICGNS